MSFEDDLRETIQKARTEGERYEKEGRDFENRWDRLRQSMILEIFRRAARIFKNEKVNAQEDLNNGSILLQAGPSNNSQQFRYTLSFHRNKNRGKEREIECSSNIPGSNKESFTLDQLTESVVYQKVIQFAEQISLGDSLRLSRQQIPDP